jgi:hypothetical protein
MDMKTMLRACAIVTAVSLAACDGFTGIKGHVRDPKGQPVEGAKVVLKTERTAYGEEKSAQDGSYSLFTSNAPLKFKMRLVISKEGYRTYEKDFDSCAKYVHDVNLETAQ